jgi:hypothetical protein
MAQRQAWRAYWEWRTPCIALPSNRIDAALAHAKRRESNDCVPLRGTQCACGARDVVSRHGWTHDDPAAFGRSFSRVSARQDRHDRTNAQRRKLIGMRQVSADRLIVNPSAFAAFTASAFRGAILWCV